jgi:hypothetical protein
MNTDTVTLIQRPYAEIVDDILTAIVGGIVNEPICYDDKEDSYPLAQPARSVRSITGTRTETVNGELKPIHFAFRQEADYLFSDGSNAIEWQAGGKWPDDETVFYVDYFPREGQPPLTDINVGSVTRTLAEAIARETAVVFEQINEAYRSGFVDSATGRSLDLVVAILDVVRLRKDHAQGRVTFFRDMAIPEGGITIPKDTLLIAKKGKATFVTAEERTLQRGQVRIDVPVRASDAFRGDPGLAKTGEINALTQPITGIASVTNFDPTSLRTDDETDEELRARAKVALRGLGKATLAALKFVIQKEGAEFIDAWDPNGASDKKADPGEVKLLIKTEPEHFESVRARVEETRAAGVKATLLARYVYFKPRVTGEIVANLPAAGKAKIVNQVIEELRRYVDGLTGKEPAEGTKLLEAIRKVKEVQDARIVDVMAWKVADKDEPPNRAGDRLLARDLVRGKGTDQLATDEQIEKGEFSVVTPGDDWFVALDVEPGDIDLAES